MTTLSKAIRSILVASLCSTAVVSQAALLEDVYQQALSNDPQLKIAEATFRSNKEILNQAKSVLLPSVAATAGTSYADSSYNSFNNHGYTISLVQPIFSAEKWFTYQQGKFVDQQAQLRFDQAQQNLILRSVETYLNVLRAQSNLSTAEAQERAIKRRLDQVNAQFDVGLIAITDVHEAQASYDNARVSLIEAEGALDNSYEALERLTGQAYSQVDVLKADYPIDNIEPATPDAWLKKGLEGNLALRLAALDINVAEQNAKIARAGHYPTVELNATHDYDKGTVSTNVLVRSNVVGIKLSVPLYQGGAISSKSRQAYAQMDASMQSHEDALRGLKQSTRSLLRDLKTNVLSVNARKQSIVSSQAALDATSEGFNVGTRNVVDVLTAEQALYAAQRDYANARLDYVLNLFKFKQTVGTLAPDDLLGLDEWLAPKS